jgi:alkylation response protein AidB-like acyl-CoA dehydrogenase
MSEPDAEFQASLRETARALLEREATSAVVRTIAFDDDQTALDELWTRIADLGWLGVEVPEEDGGVGATFAGVAVVLHEMGRALTPLPYATSTVLGGAVLQATNAEHREHWLPRLISGEFIITAALTSADGSLDAPGVHATEDDDGVRLDGEVGFVPDLATADAVCVAASQSDGQIGLYLLAASAEGVHITPQITVDRTRRLARLRCDGVRVTKGESLVTPGAGRDLLDELLDRAAVGVAAGAAGGAEMVLEMTIAYLKERIQFGRPIGSFQALKHRCADMFLAVEAARQSVSHAARVIDDPRQRLAATAIAKITATEAYAHVAAEGVQLHGGIGYTWEHDLHMHLKRAKLDEALFGDLIWHRQRLALLALADA